MSQDQHQSSNGATPPVNPLGKAIEDHARALIKHSTLPTGQTAINPVQMMLDLALAQVRIEVLFEALVERGLADPPDLMARLRAKLEAEIEFMNAPQLALAPASILDR
jgi:hypothetical protein